MHKLLTKSHLVLLFSGGCDLVLLRTPSFANDLGLEIHVRTKISTWWSFIESAVVRIGPDLLEVKGSKDSGSTYWFNGEPGDELKAGEVLSLAGFEVGFHSPAPNKDRHRIDLGNGDAIGVETFKDFVAINVHTTSQSKFHGSVGLMGSYPDGTCWFEVCQHQRTCSQSSLKEIMSQPAGAWRHLH